MLQLLNFKLSLRKKGLPLFCYLLPHLAMRIFVLAYFFTTRCDSTPAFRRTDWYLKRAKKYKFVYVNLWIQIRTFSIPLPFCVFLLLVWWLRPKVRMDRVISFRANPDQVEVLFSGIIFCPSGLLVLFVLIVVGSYGSYVVEVEAIISYWIDRLITLCFQIWVWNILYGFYMEIVHICFQNWYEMFIQYYDQYQIFIGFFYGSFFSCRPSWCCYLRFFCCLFFRNVNRVYLHLLSCCFSSTLIGIRLPCWRCSARIFTLIKLLYFLLVNFTQPVPL